MNEFKDEQASDTVNANTTLPAPSGIAKPVLQWNTSFVVSIYERKICEIQWLKGRVLPSQGAFDQLNATDFEIQNIAPNPQ